MQKLHSSVVVSIRDRASVLVDGKFHLFRVTPEEADAYAEKISEELFLRDLREASLVA
jgi:hypothetical protein